MIGPKRLTRRSTSNIRVDAACSRFTPEVNIDTVCTYKRCRASHRVTNRHYKFCAHHKLITMHHPRLSLPSLKETLQVSIVALQVTLKKCRERVVPYEPCLIPVSLRTPLTKLDSLAQTS